MNHSIPHARGITRPEHEGHFYLEKQKEDDILVDHGTEYIIQHRNSVRALTAVNLIFRVSKDRRHHQTI